MEHDTIDLWNREQVERGGADEECMRPAELEGPGALHHIVLGDDHTQPRGQARPRRDIARRLSGSEKGQSEEELHAAIAIQHLVDEALLHGGARRPAGGAIARRARWHARLQRPATGIVIAKVQIRVDAYP